MSPYHISSANRQLNVHRHHAPFTEQDDQALCRYLALRIPYKEAGGRLGKAIYKEFEVDGWKVCDSSKYTHSDEY